VKAGAANELSVRNNTSPQRGIVNASVEMMKDKMMGYTTGRPRTLDACRVSTSI
jgi:hypothetical protein